MNEVTTMPAGAMTAIAAPTNLLPMIERMSRDPSIDVEKLDRLLAMYERMKAQEAEQCFNDAMAAAQGEMEPIRTDSSNEHIKRGGQAAKYASYAALDHAIRPIYSRHGFGVSFNTQEPRSKEPLEIGVVAYVTCKGHTRVYTIDMPTDGKGARGGDVMTRTHATGSGVSYGMRYLLKMIFNLSTEDAAPADDDGNAAGGRGPSQQQRQATQQAASGQPPRDDAGPPKPHILKPIANDNAEAWSDRFIALVDTCNDADELGQWDKLNEEFLGKVHKLSTKDRPVYAKIDAAFARCHTRIKAMAGSVAETQQSPAAAATARKPAAGEPATSAGANSAPEAKASHGAPDEASDRFPTPWVRQTPATYVAWALAWMARSPDAAVPTNEAIDKRWADERKIRNGLADPLTEEHLEKLNEARGEAKARAKAKPYDPAAPGVATSRSTGGDGKPGVSIPNPEAFIKDTFARFKGAKTGEELELIFNRDIQPHFDKLMEPDQSEILGAYRRRESELAP